MASEFKMDVIVNGLLIMLHCLTQKNKAFLVDYTEINKS